MDLYKESLINKIEDDLAGRNQNWAAIEEEVIRIDGDIQNIRETGYRYVDTLYLTANATFEKANYPWLRAVKVKCQAGGGAGSYHSAVAAGGARGGGGGGGGEYAESFLKISDFGSSMAVTVGEGGTSTTTSSDPGGNSSFGNLVIAVGGEQGTVRTDTTGTNAASGGRGGTGGVGDLLIPGESGGNSLVIDGKAIMHGQGGGSVLGRGGQLYRGIDGVGGSGGEPGVGYGSGGQGALSQDNQPALAGASGAPGIVIIELYA